MPALTIEQVTAEPWKYNSTQWRIVHGIHIPHIAEISPMQYGHLSKAARRRYDAKRDAEWEASAAGVRAWQDAVIAANDAGTINYTTPGLSEEARSHIIQTEIARKKAEEEAARKQKHADARFTDVAEFEPGQEVYCIPYRLMVQVIKRNRKTVKVSHPFGDVSLPPHCFSRIDLRTA